MVDLILHLSFLDMEVRLSHHAVSVVSLSFWNGITVRNLGNVQ